MKKFKLTNEEIELLFNSFKRFVDSLLNLKLQKIFQTQEKIALTNIKQTFKKHHNNQANQYFHKFYISKTNNNPPQQGLKVKTMIQRLFINHRSLTKSLRFSYIEDWGEHFVRPLNIPTPKEYKNMYRQTPELCPVPRVRASFQDALYMPGLDQQRLYDIQREILLKGEVALSNQFIAMLLYHLTKNRMMLKETMDIIEDWVPRHKGEYTSREIFGCIYGMIILNKPKHMRFFLDEVQATNLEFQLAESLQIIQALNQNTVMTLEEKHKFWEDNFKSAFVNNMHRLLSSRISTVLRIFDAFHKFEYYDEEIWDKIITMMDNKTGWARTAIIERLYPLTGTFEKAKLLFDKYYTKLSTNKNILWRYNLEQLRLYSSEQMIAKSQQNIQLEPHFRSMIPLEKLDEMTKRYDDWLVNGAVKKEEEIIRDKSASFGYAIKERFESLTKDNIDFSKMTKSEFEELFGEYDEAMMKEKEEAPQGEQEQQH